MKWPGAVLLVFCGALSGWQLCRRTGKQEKYLDAVQNLIQTVSAQLRFACPTVEEILENIGREHRFEILSFLRECLLQLNGATPFPAAWESSITKSDCPLTNGDKEKLIAFGAALGNTDLAGALAHCGLYECYFARRAEEMRQSNQKNQRLFPALGMGLGLTAALLFW